MRVRNIELEYRCLSGQFVTQQFVDWWDLADWLKEREVTGKELIVIKRWKYVERRL